MKLRPFIDRLRKSPLLGRVLAPPARAVGDWRRRKIEIARWSSRIADAVASPDNAFIPRVRFAGCVFGTKQVMHNGLRIHVGSYYGPGMSKLLKANRGVHEPQEERVFAEVLRQMPPSATMIELGSYWGFYSMWFSSVVKSPRCLLVEPDADNLDAGRRNFRLNRMSGAFVQAAIGATSRVDEAGRRVISLSDLITENNIGHVDILHSDIQGFENEMLRGAERLLRTGVVSYLFISTHYAPGHAECVTLLKQYGFDLIAVADLDGTFSVDGLIVARHSSQSGLGPMAISDKRLLLAQSGRTRLLEKPPLGSSRNLA